MKEKSKIKFIYISLALLIVFVMLFAHTGQTYANAPTRTPKYCHICDDIHIISTQIQTPQPSASPTSDYSDDCSTCTYFDSQVLALTQTAIFANLTQTPLAPAQPVENTSLAIYFFWGQGCPHCADAKPVLEDITFRHPEVKLYSYEVYNSAENQQLFKDIATEFGMEPRYVPTIFIGDYYFEGFSDSIQAQIEQAVEQCLTDGCPNVGAALVEPAQPGVTPTPGDEISPITPPVATTLEPSPTPHTPESPKEVIRLPLIGEVDLSEHSLFFSTLIISFVDGFNPCSIWVLTMLLSITLHSGSRRKTLIIGFVFITVTALIYALFIAGLFTVFTFISFTGWIQVIVALVALFFALINIKDYFFYKEGISLTIDEQQKPGLYKRMRRVTEAGDSLWGLIGATIVLAAGVSIVEFTCTAGFPVIWTNLLSSQNVTALTFILLLLVYMLIYQLDELGIFLVAVFTLRSSKLEEKHGRVLKLIGGMLMLTLAGVMLVKPSLMSDLSDSLIVFGIAFAATALLLLLHRVILPKMGIRIGNEMTKSKKRHRKSSARKE